MTNIGLITNITGFEQALEDVKARSPEPVMEVRLAVTLRVAPSELGATQTNGILLIGCNKADKYLVGVAIMSVFEQVPVEHVNSTAKYNDEMLKLVRKQTVAMEDIAKILRARA